VTSGGSTSTATGGEARVRVVPNQWKLEKGAVLGNLTTIGSENSYPLPSPSLTPSNHMS